MSIQMPTAEKQGRQIHIEGIVQGVGFRPFVYSLAERYGLTGWVRNTSAGVDIEVDGRSDNLDAFVESLQEELPPLAHIDTFSVANTRSNGYTQFKIVHSQAVAKAFQPISPDVAICEDCLRELFDPTDRHYRYPFINCTNCGPRFTITKDIPYDRPLTTMAPFDMCPECAAEYKNPANRRFHAQPVACPSCGPEIWLELKTDTGFAPAERGEDGLQATKQRLLDGEILGIKGLGGFHLACDALNETAVSTLRQRKLRREKPFALMMADLDTVQQHCYLNEIEAEALTSRARPILLLRKRPSSPIVAVCAPGQDQLGVMLPYTPLHYLLMEKGPGAAEVLVMTSGNLSEEPIAYTNDDARQRLAPLADALLLHNRDIYIRCDDSVTRVFTVPAPDGTEKVQTMPIRRSRGYAPFPVQLPWEIPPTLATGGELKNTFCLSNGRFAFLSHHIGDMENYETLQSFRSGVAHFEQLFRVQPALLAYDLHPNYLASRYALERAAAEGLPAIGVQHHHAHIAAALAENQHPGNHPVIGLSFDGTGYGPDGTIWGGECLLADYAGYERPFHLRPIPLAGGDLAVRQPWRLALAWLLELGLDFSEWQENLAQTLAAASDQPQLQVVTHQLKNQVNAPLTSSMGRLFDAVAALANVRLTVNYEAQAAMMLETLINPQESGAYAFALDESNGMIDPAPLFAEMVSDLRVGTAVSTIAARFHNGVAKMSVDVSTAVRAQTSINEVALSGGVWQNVALLQRTIPQLEKVGFHVIQHKQVPPNDGGLALGQLIIAAKKFESG
ncbi:MAG: carbamoyltransferase HypF [Ardenticatenaceae bacterium]|nr:carbamoyltransferase HypF [Ardenticatenaceae bacterium]